MLQDFLNVVRCEHNRDAGSGQAGLRLLKSSKGENRMDFTLSKEHEMLRKMYREFAETEVKPLAAEIDEEERFPMETVEKMAKLSMMGIYFPK